MNDAGLIIKTALLAQTPFTDVFGTRLWPESATPVAGYQPIQGPAAAFRIRGGQLMYKNGLMSASTQFKIWGIDEITANAGYRVLVDVLHNRNPGAIRSAYLEQPGQTSIEQSPFGWPYVLAFFTIWLAI